MPEESFLTSRLDEALGWRNSGRLIFTTDRDAAYAEAEIIFICVGTEAAQDGSANLETVMQVAREIGEALERSEPRRSPPLIVIKSTVPVGTSHRVGELIRSVTADPARRHHATGSGGFDR